MNSDKLKLLVAGGSHSDIPLIVAAQSLGYHVTTSGNDPQGIGHQYSDQYCPEDFSDKQAMLELAKSLRIDSVCASCNDFSALSAAFVAEQMSLPGHDAYETALTIHHKDRFREFARANGFPSPSAKGFSTPAGALEAVAELSFPLIIKPVDLTGGKGVSIANNFAQAVSSVEYAFRLARARRIVVEEFIDGSKHGLSIFLRDGKVVFHFGDDEHYYQNPYLVSAASSPSSIPDSTLLLLCDHAERMAQVLSLKTGIFHIQYIQGKMGPVFIEICRRAPGDLYIQFVRLATGVNYPEFIVRANAGLDCRAINRCATQGFFTRHCVMAERNGEVDRINYDPRITKRIVDQMMWWRPGRIIKDHLTEKCGIVFLKFASRDEMLELTPQLPELIKVVIRS